MEESTVCLRCGHVCFAEELIAAYPEARVILSLRDVDSWYNSMLATVVKVSKSRVLDILGSFGPVFLRHWNPMRKSWGRLSGMEISKAMARGNLRNIMLW